MKEFDEWNNEKKRIDSREDYVPYYKEREVRWCQLGANIGFEQDGKGSEFARPVLILKGFNRRMCLVVPLTTKLKDNKYYVALGEVGERESMIIISQVRPIDTRRLGRLISVIESVQFEFVKEKIKAML